MLRTHLIEILALKMMVLFKACVIMLSYKSQLEICTMHAQNIFVGLFSYVLSFYFILFCFFLQKKKQKYSGNIFHSSEHRTYQRNFPHSSSHIHYTNAHTYISIFASIGLTNEMYVLYTEVNGRTLTHSHRVNNLETFNFEKVASFC